MISFRCGHCGKDLKVKEQLAGKKGKCPGCGRPLAVPQANAATLASQVKPGSRNVKEERTLAPEAPAEAEERTLPPKTEARLERKASRMPAGRRRSPRARTQRGLSPGAPGRLLEHRLRALPRGLSLRGPALGPAQRPGPASGPSSRRQGDCEARRPSAH
jgi:hypothetical protein